MTYKLEPTTHKNYDGSYTVFSNGIFRFDKEYNSKGVYQGQWQTNMLDETGDFYFSANLVDGVPYVDGNIVPNLTDEEMDSSLE